MHTQTISLAAATCSTDAAAAGNVLTAAVAASACC
jgi:hypothetical protein